MTGLEINNLPSEEFRPLDKAFCPGPLDVICARGKVALNHLGNRIFRKTVESYLPQYAKAKTKLEKTNIVCDILQSVRTASPNGGFVKEHQGAWYEVGDHIAREKVGQSLRDLLHTKYRSSTKAKTRRRQWMNAQIKESIDQCRNSLVELDSNESEGHESTQREESSEQKMDSVKSMEESTEADLQDKHLERLFTEANCNLLDKIKTQFAVSVNEESMDIKPLGVDDILSVQKNIEIQQQETAAFASSVFQVPL